jgi:hypothetical protein
MNDVEAGPMQCLCPGGPGSCGYWNGKGCTHDDYARATQLRLSIWLERDDDIPAFAAFLRCDPPSKDNHVMYLNVQACMAGIGEDADGNEVPMSRRERMQFIITSLMHEFGHALESQFGLPVNEDMIEKACEQWDSAMNDYRELMGGCHE